MHNSITQKQKTEMKIPVYCGQISQSGKMFFKDRFGTKRLVKFKILSEIDLTLILINLNYAHHLGYKNLESLLSEIGLTDTGANLYHAPALSKVFKFLHGEFLATDPNPSDFYKNLYNLN